MWSGPAVMNLAVPVLLLTDVTDLSGLHDCKDSNKNIYCYWPWSKFVSNIQDLYIFDL